MRGRTRSRWLGGSSANYELTWTNGVLTIGKAALELVADNKSKTYGQANPDLTFSVVGLVNGDTKAPALTSTPTLSTVAASSGAGTHPITLVGGTSANYELTRTNGVLTINKAALTVTVDSNTATPEQDAFTKLYGAANPPFTVRYTGFVTGEGPGALGWSLAFTTSATTLSPVGTYDVEANGQTSGNYTISYGRACCRSSTAGTGTCSRSTTRRT